MKKELMIRTLQSPIQRADIHFKDGITIMFGFNVHIITYCDRHFTCDGCELWRDNKFKYSEVKSIEVFE